MTGVSREEWAELREQHDKSVAMQRCSCTFGARCDMARILDALAAERAKVAGLREELTEANRMRSEWHAGAVEGVKLREAVDKVRALHPMRVWQPYPNHPRREYCGNCASTTEPGRHLDWPCPTVALLPDVQADDREWLARNVSAATGYSRAELDELGGFRADDSGTCTCTPEWKSNQDSHDGYCPATVVQSNVTPAEQREQKVREQTIRECIDAVRRSTANEQQRTDDFSFMISMGLQRAEVILNSLLPAGDPTLTRETP